jgi:hypothetical protein
MTCQDLRDVIVDAARGVAVGRGSQAAIDAHLEQCAACRRMQTREQQLTSGLRALGAATTANASSAVSDRLRQAFAERHTAPVSVPVARRRWLQTAAAALLVAGGLTAWRLFMPRETVSPTKVPAAISTPGESHPKAELRPAPIELTAAIPKVTQRSVRSASPRAAIRAARVIHPEGFVLIPSAIGLPDFESGQIIRMELPVASLPDYGIQIVPDARSLQIEADLLVGQDGQARAIRLVASSQEPRSR